MSHRKVVCPRCGQDWLLNVQLVHLKRDVIFCPECDAIWLDRTHIAASSFRDYSEYMIEQGRKNPEDPKEIVIIGALTVEENGH